MKASEKKQFRQEGIEMIRVMDCTLRDGGNVVGKGFPADLTVDMIKALLAANVDYIEMGNAGGIGAYEVAGFTKAETDEKYLELIQPFVKTGKVGMFLNATRYREKYVELGASKGLAFLRVGTDADEPQLAVEPIHAIKKRGVKAFYSAMKAYLVTPEQLAESAKMLEAEGLDEFTVMDSAGCMLPEEVAKTVEVLKKAVNIPIAFHCHNNLALSAANALAAYKAGVDILDGGLMGMARSAGNLPTEAGIALLHRYGEAKHVELYGLLEYIAEDLEPKMKERYDYHNALTPFDLVLGITGLHSSKGKLFKQIAKETGVNLYKLMVDVGKINRKNPSEELIRSEAVKVKEAQ